MRTSIVRLIGLTLLAASTAGAQVRTIDPNRAIDGDLAGPAPQQTVQPAPTPVAPLPADEQPATAQPPQVPAPPPPDERSADATRRSEETFARDDLLAAGEGVFGKGAQGLAGIVEKILKEQGQPNAYIAGREASGAFVVGLRYGSGVMTHKVEGQLPVYWTGPSVGFDVGGDANKVFVLVYNLYDTADVFKRFPAGEGRLYAIGGFAASYLRRGNIVLIPIRLGVGWRAGVNVGYMKFSRKSKILPF
jgi:hypothetical protein